MYILSRYTKVLFTLRFRLRSQGKLIDVSVNAQRNKPVVRIVRICAPTNKYYNIKGNTIGAHPISRRTLYAIRLGIDMEYFVVITHIHKRSKYVIYYDDRHFKSIDLKSKNYIVSKA